MRHLLNRSSGLPLRESGIYTTQAHKQPELKALIMQDLKPAVLPPGQAISHHSFGDLLLAEMLSAAGGKPFPELVKQEILNPLGIKGIKLPDVKAKPRLLSGHDSQGLPFRELRASAHDIHGWIATPDDIVPLLQALLGKYPAVITPAMRQHLFRRSLNLHPELPTSSLGLLESSLLGHRYFYIDTDWFGQTARLAVFPEQGQAMYLAYNSSHPALLKLWLSEQIQQSWGQAGASSSLNRDDAAVNVIIQEPQLLPGLQAYAPGLRDNNSLLKFLNLLEFRHLLPQAEQLSWNGEPWHLAQDFLWKNTQGELLAFPAARTGYLQEGYGQHGFWYQKTIWQSWPLQLAYALLFCLLFLSVLYRSGRFLYAYEPQLDLGPEPINGPEPNIGELELADSTGVATDPGTASEPLVKVEPPGWDVPTLGLIVSMLGLVFTTGIYPVMLFADKVGDHLSLVLRNEPSGLLIVWLALPLFALVGALILLALMVTEWQQRAWTRREKWHYLGLVLAMPFWVSWLASWNLIGFKF
ncbi:MAG: hypothetical protein CVV27_03270 [Candidatus Melainabacteria bacterium HGW-Melainabacteria-1]|nr:MAG: hypothetical protein CVV27_03270 [Candidatus Melainabacteria bacterium HGW-Melainabacteria-1]